MKIICLVYMKKFCLVFLLQGIVATLMAGEYVSITGVFPGAEGEEIRLMRYDDHLSFREAELASAVIDDEGTFAFEIQVEAAELLFFRFQYTRNFFYVEPGNTYTVEFAPFSFADKKEGTDYHPARLSHSMSIDSEDPAGVGLNDLIERLEELAEEFVRTRISGNIRANHQAAMRDLNQQADSLFQGVDHPFFSDYKTYYLARLSRTLNTRGFTSLVEEYLSDRPVLYNHPEYMDFFRQLFSTYLFAGSRDIRISDLEAAVNQQESYEALMAVLEKDSVLKNERLRELLMLDGLKEMRNMEDFEPSGVVQILEEVAAASKYPEHRQIAQNLLYLHRRFQPGQPAPSLALKNHRGEKVFPDDFSGRYVYLFFWAGWCNRSMAELGPMDELAGELEDKVHFVGVLTDHDPATAAHLLENEDLAVSFYHFDGDYRMLDDYGVWNIPYYVLIGPDGDFVKHPFISPSEGAIDYLHEIVDN